MNFVKKAASCCMISMLFLAASPVQAAYNPIEASDARCDRVTGREKARCLSIAHRNKRIRLRQSRSQFERGATMREQRATRRFVRNTNIRSRGNVDLSRLRKHDTKGVSARRLINRRDEAARSACKDLQGTEKYVCIRKNTRNSTRGNVR